MGQTRTYCRLCEVGCGLVATVEDGRLQRVRPDRDHVVTRGFACSKGLMAAELHADPDRVRTPLRRVGDKFVTVSWDEALSEIGSRMRALVDQHGPQAVGLYLGNPNAFNALGSAAGMIFMASLGSDRTFSAATQDCTNKYAVAELLYGTAMANPIPDLEHSELVLVIGANPRVSKSSFLSIPDPVRALQRVRDRGGRVVFVNPLLVEPDVGDTLQLRPDSDPYLLAALLHEINRTVGFRLGALDGRVEDVEDVVRFVAPYSPEAVADVVGLSAAVIRQLADDIVRADSTSIHVSTGLNMGRQGALAYWLAQMVVLLTGNLDRAGGNYFAARSVAAPPAPVDRSADSFESTRWGPVRRAVGMLPAALLPDMIEEPAEPLRALLVAAGNPALTVGGGARLAEALSSLDVLVTIDLYRNATGELADFVLPATDQFEREDLNVFVQGVQGEPYAQWSDRVVAPDGDQREEWRIYGDILRAMGLPSMFDGMPDDPFPALFDGVLAGADVSMAQLRTDDGVVPLAEPGPGGSVERMGIAEPIACVPEAFRSTLDRAHALFGELVAEPPGQLKLITRRTRNQLNSTLRNVGSVEGRDPSPNPLWMHPDDAARLGLAEAARAQISNDFGAIEADVALDARLRPGVVAMTHGFGDASTAGMRNAQRCAGVNVNVLAPSGPGTFDPVSGMSHITGIPVTVVAAVPAD